MNANRLRQVEELYHSARELEPVERRAFLSEASRGDEELRREVESLLAQDGLSGLMEQPPLEVAAKLLADATVTQLPPGTQLGPYRNEAALGSPPRCGQTEPFHSYHPYHLPEDRDQGRGPSKPR